MKKLLERITRRGGETPPSESAAPQEMPEGGLPTESAPCGTTEAAPKPPPELPLFFMLSHLDDDGPVRLDGVKLGVCEVMGLEIDEPKLGAFAGALNALDFPAQLLIRQHAPRLERLRDDLREAQPKDLYPRRRGRPPSPSSGCSPSLRPATASSTGASTPCASSGASTSCADCWRGPGCPSTRSGTASFGCSWCPQPWADRQPSSTRRPPSRWR